MAACSLVVAVYLFGYLNGISNPEVKIEEKLVMVEKPVIKERILEVPVIQKQTNAQNKTWSGPELWEEVNAKRKIYGVNPLANKEEICTIASLRLNELLDAGKLDGHEGFTSLPERRKDLAAIFDKYNLTEFLLSGAQSAKEAVSMWENTLGHRKLLTGGEYVWGCIYAQDTFAVAITAY